MRTPFLPLSMFMAVFTANGQSWTVLPTATSYDLQDVWSLPQHPDTGVVCGSYLDGAEILPFAMRTTNGGVTMVPQDVSFGGNFTGAFAMDFVEGNTGYMCGGGVLATYNGGQGWGQLVDVFEVNGTLYDVDALTTEDVYAVGEAFDATGMAMVTHDGWNNWATSIISDVNDDENTFMTAVVRATANRLYAGASAGISGMPTLFL
ncbi:MAG: hypothetical protein KBG86_12410, partial [Flavobacteriales bacterium]|nr:hypothetical protein [Flavobacteriales bacterium]